MLPKPEKIKKASKTEQLNLVETLDSAKKIRRKRFWLILTLFLTIGLSLIFWVYYSVNRLVTTNKFPQLFHPPVASDSGLDQPVSSLLRSDSNTWSIYLKSSSGPPFVWSKNFPAPIDKDINSIVNTLRGSPAKTDGLVGFLLPSGAIVREADGVKTDSVEVNSLITFPDHEFLLLIKVAGSNNLNHSQTLISRVAQVLYWELVKL